MTFSLLVTVLRRRWITVAIGACIGLLLGLAMGLLIPTTYSSTASLVVSPVVTNPFSETREDVNIRTEQEILGSREVAERASELLGIPLEPDSVLLTQADVAAPSGSQILQMTVQADSPQQAADAANALSQAYLEFRREGADATIQQYLERIDAQLTSLQSQANDSGTDRLIEVLQEQRLNLILTGVEPGRIIGNAEVPSGPSSPGLKITLPGGLAVGALLGVVAAIVIERLDRRVRSADRLARAVGGIEIVEDHRDGRFWSTLGDEVLLAIDTKPEALVDGMLVLLTRLGWQEEEGTGTDLQRGIESALVDALEIEAMADIRRMVPTSSGRIVAAVTPLSAPASGEAGSATPAAGHEGAAVTAEAESGSSDDVGDELDVEAAVESEATSEPVTADGSERAERLQPLLPTVADGRPIVAITDASSVQSAGRLERRAEVSDVAVVLMSSTADLALAKELITVLREAGGPVVVGYRA